MKTIEKLQDQTGEMNPPEGGGVRDATRPTLDLIVRAICADARHDTVKYLLRSDTGEDGE